MKFLQEIGIPELTENQMQTLAEIAEKTARAYVFSNVSHRKITRLDISIETVGTKPVTVTVNIDLKLSPLLKSFNEEKLANEAAERALEGVERWLRELSCRSKT